MIFRHEIKGCLDGEIGARGLAASELDAMLERTGPALASLRRRHADHSLPLLDLPGRHDDVASLVTLADEFRSRFSHVVILGTGGSSLGGQTLTALADQGFGPRPGAPKLLFMDNIDPATFAALFAALDPARTGIIAISKSGSTAETLSQLILCMAWLRGALGAASIGDRIVALTEPRDNVLRRLAACHGMRLLDHDPGIGGRFSVLSNVALLPALIAGLDADAVRDGAGLVLDACLAAATPRDAAPALGAALSVALAQKGASTTVMMPYIDRLAPFGMWYRQLWAESLGKAGKGTTPVRAMGTVDQHSQLQLYLAGPADKMFTLVLLDVAGTGGSMKGDLATDGDIAYLSGRTIGDLLDAEQRATAATLIRNGNPTRIIGLPALGERSLGALLMHFMLETIIAADLLGVDAFDQPAVEEGKVLARQYLGEMPR